MHRSSALQARDDPLDTVLLSGMIHTLTSRVGERGQITIEKSIREELGIYAGDETVQRVEDGRVRLLDGNLDREGVLPGTGFANGVLHRVGCDLGSMSVGGASPP